MHVVEKRLALFLADGAPVVSVTAVDGALDLEQRVQPLDRLQCDRGDRFTLLALPSIFLDVSQLEEASPGMGKAIPGVIGSVFFCGSNSGSKPL
ncbi:hypothetical protein J2R78_008690 [Bradyrhizobium sp. USDA 4538]|nr:hypothetical protein [Bradyrhizobium sp. USDA 4538]MCP1907020.1 hypothetical protein [Bradyrhizobium sp. USDA 4537]MCP1985496.1 hypothetical protein [Bradyrhizobium sp. USDA 4539]